MNRFILASLFILLCIPGFADDAPSPDFSLPFSDSLSMDVYMPADTIDNHYCVIFAYGGGFKYNNQKSASTRRFCRKLSSDGYVAIAVDYRLGLKGVKMNGVLGMAKPLTNAVHMATEDVLKAVRFVLDHYDELKVLPSGIVLCGSSAGAISSLQADYELCNRTSIASHLPEDFRFAGIASFAGAVLSTRGKCKYTVHEPAPTLLLHGDIDKLVCYNRIAFFSTRLCGSSDLVKSFKSSHYSHAIVRYVDEGHGVAARMMESYDEFAWFMANMVKSGRHYEIDKTVFDRDHKRTKWDKVLPKSIYH